MEWNPPTIRTIVGVSTIANQCWISQFLGVMPITMVTVVVFPSFSVGHFQMSKEIPILQYVMNLPLKLASIFFGPRGWRGWGWKWLVPPENQQPWASPAASCCSHPADADSTETLPDGCPGGGTSPRAGGWRVFASVRGWLTMVNQLTSVYRCL